MTLEDIARICHEANRAYCETIGDHSQKPWDEAEQWQRDSAVAGVRWRLENHGAAPGAQHEQWLRDKQKDGWVYGTVKDPGKKTHPCMVPFSELPWEQRIKDVLFAVISESLIVRTHPDAHQSKSA